MVMHDRPSAVASWVHAAKLGDVVGVRGPRMHLNPPPGTSRIVCVGDETFLPATAAVLEHIAPSLQVDVLLETVDAGHEVSLPDRPGARVRWVHRGSDRPGESSALLDAVRRLDLEGGQAYVCGGGEAQRMTEIRKYLRGERGLASSQVSVVGYWRRA